MHIQIYKIQNVITIHIQIKIQFQIYNTYIQMYILHIHIQIYALYIYRNIHLHADIQ